MNKLNFSCLTLLCCIFMGCAKIENVHFQGHCINTCDSSDAGNLQFEIYRVYDTGHEKWAKVGNVYTDQNGNYSESFYVSLKGSLYYYNIALVPPGGNSRSLTGAGRSDYPTAANNTDDEVLLNGYVRTGTYLNFHIKNTTQADHTDKLLSFAMSNYGRPYATLASNLSGMSVDTTVQYFARTVDLLYYTYSFYRSGRITTVTDTMQGSCAENTYVDVFY